MTQPSAYEQYMLELVNRARLNPLAEAAFYGIDLNQDLSPGTISSETKQVLAFNSLLIDSARDHSQWMLDTDTFSHTGAGGSNPGQRMQAAGYNFTGSWTWGENIAYKGTTGTPNVTQFTADKHQGLFLNSGHRKNILNDNFREIGIGIKEGEYKGYNAVMTTQKFAKSGSSIFLTGVVYDDSLVDDDFYSVGEGLSGISVQAVRQSDNSVFSTTTMNAGGYQIALAAGTYDVTFSVNGSSYTNTVTIDSKNVKLDLIVDNYVSTLLGGSSALMKGNGLKNKLLGDSSDQEIRGYGGNDYINGAGGKDWLRGGNGHDQLIGGKGNDRLGGWSGNDILVGVNPDDDNPGFGEIDQLQGHLGSDTFVLGDAAHVYYNHGGTRWESWKDRALILDFNPAQDVIQLHGSASQYELLEAGSDTRIFYGDASSGFNELIGVVKGVASGLDLSGSEFSYV